MSASEMDRRMRPTLGIASSSPVTGFTFVTSPCTSSTKYRPNAGEDTMHQP